MEYITWSHSGINARLKSNMRPYKKYSETIRKLRKQKGWSQEELAERSKLDPKSIVQLENAKRNPTLKTIQKIASAFNIPISKLLEG